ncbi:hypothetical protein [Clostridium cellulovorans]|uniref:Uncharacterized protein n=1 Tax=Clostridium cellulovorans (strain ATCC 35296 / DSM 3052 / OCM 3 / 743B) TaxID=573061 RepID=D9SQ03_CLOC7|nr:hypothetical protein [Clostridium cellulovorans]ADL52139.1 hypothetical protein Clocel_2426 [Clostridium cellulovorans 743B]
MRSKTYFYDGVAYNSSDMAVALAGIITTGVSPIDETGIESDSCLKVLQASASNAVNVYSGVAWINGHYFELTDGATVTLQPSDATRNRTDSIVLKMDITAKTVTLRSEMGSYSGSLYVPVRNQYVWELILAQVYIGAGTSFYTQSNITDTRYNPNFCGICTTPQGTLQSQIDELGSTVDMCIKATEDVAAYTIIPRKTYTELEVKKLNVTDEVNQGIFKVYMPNNARVAIEAEVIVSTRNISGQGAILEQSIKCVGLTDASGNVFASNGISVGSASVQTSGVTSYSITASLSVDSVNKYVVFSVKPNEEPQDVISDIIVRAKITYIVEGVIQQPGITVI